MILYKGYFYKEGAVALKISATLFFCKKNKFLTPRARNL